MADDRVALVKQVKEANDIVEVVGSYVTLRPVGPTFKGLCPFHDDHRPSFDVDPRRQRYRCWSCGKYGDVLNFVQEHERVDFREALELLARRAGIKLENWADSPQGRTRAVMLEAVRWAAEEYHRCLFEDPIAETARTYVEERGIRGDTAQRFSLGFAPPAWDWLVERAGHAGMDLKVLADVGLIAPRREANGYYDRFRDRVMFPIRDTGGRAVGFGGRILPSSPFSDRGPKYYNSSDTPLFSKSEQLYGLYQALQSTRSMSYLAVVEGYTDVLMAHQAGISHVVATMGTALNARHVQHLRRFVPRVVLVFDADAGGNTGVDRALEIFATQNMDLAIATLPEGLDPCDLLVRQGADAFRKVLAEAVDALDFKLNQVLASAAAQGIEGKRRAVEAVLGIIALAPEVQGQDAAIKQQLIVTRISQRLAIKEETIWARLRELRARRLEAEARRQSDEEANGPNAAVPLPREKQLLEVLLAEPALVAVAAKEIAAAEVVHPGLRRLLEGLYALLQEGEPPDLDQLRPRLDNPRLAEAALRLQEVGRLVNFREKYLRELLAEFRRLREALAREEIQTRLQVASDHHQALDLLRRLQSGTNHHDPEPPAQGGSG